MDPTQSCTSATPYNKTTSQDSTSFPNIQPADSNRGNPFAGTATSLRDASTRPLDLSSVYLACDKTIINTPDKNLVFINQLKQEIEAFSLEAKRVLPTWQTNCDSTRSSKTSIPDTKKVSYGDTQLYDQLKPFVVRKIRADLCNKEKSLTAIVGSLIAYRAELAEITKTPESYEFTRLRSSHQFLNTPLGEIKSKDGSLRNNQRYEPFLEGIFQNIPDNEDYFFFEHSYKRRSAQQDIILSRISYGKNSSLGELKINNKKMHVSDILPGNFLMGGLIVSHTEFKEFAAIADELTEELAAIRAHLDKEIKTLSQTETDTALKSAISATYLLTHSTFCARGFGSIGEWFGAAVLGLLFPDVSDQTLFKLVQNIDLRSYQHKTPESMLKQLIDTVKKTVTTGTHSN